MSGAAYSATRNGFTPGPTVSNWTLDADAAGDIAFIQSIGWGGSGTTSTGYVSRWARPTAVGVGIPTSIVPQQHTPGSQAAQCIFAFAYATTEPADPAVTIGLHIQNWNVHGGLGYLALPIAAPWIILNGNAAEQAITCITDTGTEASTSSYSAMWTE